MTRDEVRAFIRAEIVRLAREASIALLVDGDRYHPAVIFMRENGGHAAAAKLTLEQARDPRFGKPAAEAFANALTEKLCSQICERLRPDQRTLVAIKEAVGIPRQAP